MAYQYRQQITYQGVRIERRANTEKELAEKIARAKFEIDADLATRCGNTTVSVWWSTYVKRYMTGKVSYKTEEDRTRIFNNKIKPVIGSFRISAVRPSQCQDIVNSLAGYSRDYINKTCQLMYNLFKYAKIEKMIISNPAENLVRPPAVNGHGRALTLQERALILSVIDSGHKSGLWVKVMLYGGLRPSETDRLLGCHINYDENVIFVDGTKSAAARRIVPLPKDVIWEIKDLRKSSKAHIFTNDHGYKMQTSSRSKLWHSLVREMNIRAGCSIYRNKIVEPVVPTDCIPYCCRHTFATDLKDANIPFRIRQELLGHANSSVTDRYSHRTLDSLHTARDLLEEFRQNQQHTIETEQKRFELYGWDSSAPATSDSLTAQLFPDML